MKCWKFNPIIKINDKKKVICVYVCVYVLND